MLLYSNGHCIERIRIEVKQKGTVLYSSYQQLIMQCNWTKLEAVAYYSIYQPVLDAVQSFAPVKLCQA